jgi:tetratricopeptide (TPR) repeat protein
MRLTAKERVLLHLLECGRSSDDVEVSPDLAQEGVARGAGIELRHFAQFVHPLIEEDLVRERTAHVTGIRQRRKVYALTASGQASAIRLRDRVRSEVIRVRDGDAVRERSLDQALREVGTGASLLEAVRQVQEAGMLDLELARRPPETGLVEHISDAPRTTTFVGRQEELAEITREDGGPQVFVIRGIAGIGKTALASKACDLVRGRRNLFWHRIRPWESSPTVLARLGRFLDALDRPGLSSVLKRGEHGLAAEVLRQDLPDTHAFLVFDDAHDASRETLGILRMLTDAAPSAPGVRILILTRRALSFYDARDTTIRGMVREIELDGLTPLEAAALLAGGGDSSKLVGLGRRLAGHPLLIELVRSQRSDIPAAVRDVHRFIEETIYRELSEAERTAMKAASLYRVPVPRAVLLSVPGSSYDALMTLQERSLLRFVGGERYEVHDTIRDFFGNVLTPEESRNLGTLAVAELRALAVRASAGGDLVTGIDCLSNAIRLSGDSSQKADLLESLGDTEGRLGDFPAALIAYREALGLVAAPGSVARLHRKIANALQVRGEIASASAEVEEALRSLEDRDDVERGWLSLVRSRMSAGAEQWSEGRQHAEGALKTFRSFGDIRGQAEALIELAVVETNSPEGHAGVAEQWLEDALRLSRLIGDPALIANVHVQFANLDAYRLGDSDRAMEHLGAIEALPWALGDVRSHQSLLLLKGWLNLDLRADFVGARANFEDARILSMKTHDRITAALARYGAAVAVYHAGDCVAARGELEAVSSELLDLGAAGPAVEALGMAAEISLVLGDLAGYRAIAAGLKRPALARGLEARPVMAHAMQGIDCLARGDRAAAHGAFRQAIRDAERDVSPQERPLIPFAHDLYGVALKAMGEEEKAAEQERLATEFSKRFGLNGRLAARVKFMDGLHRSLRQLSTSAPVARDAR